MKMGIATVLGLALYILAFSAFMFWALSTKCENAWADMGGKYTLGSGCTIEVNGIRIPASAYMVVE